MSFKLFENNDVTLLDLSNEEMLQNTIDQNEIDTEISDVFTAINIARESAASLSIAIENAKNTLNTAGVYSSDVVNLNLIIATTCDSVGLSSESYELSSESISNPKEALELSIEEGANVLTKIINGISKTFARFNNILGKYLGKFDTLLSSLGTNLNKDLMNLKDAEKAGKKLDTETISDGSWLGWRGFTLMGAMGIGKMSDPTAGLKEMIKIYSDKNYISKLTDSITDMMIDDKKLVPLYGNKDALKVVENNLGKKIKNFFCKSTENDRLIIGTTGSIVFILERCKPLHITFKAMPYNYTVVNFVIPSKDLFGTPKTFKAPTYKDMYSLIDDAKKMVSNNSKIVDEIHNVLKIGSNTVAKIDDAGSWENSNIYGLLPLILLVFSKTYSEVPNSVDSLAKVFLKEVN